MNANKSWKIQSIWKIFVENSCNLLPLNDIMAMRYNCVWFVDDKLACHPWVNCSAKFSCSIYCDMPHTELFSYWHRNSQRTDATQKKAQAVARKISVRLILIYAKRNISYNFTARTHTHTHTFSLYLVLLYKLTHSPVHARAMGKKSAELLPRISNSREVRTADKEPSKFVLKVGEKSRSIGNLWSARSHPNLWLW